MSKTSISLLAIIALFMFLPVAAYSEPSIFKYKDQNGAVHYVDAKDKIPEEFRTDDLKPHKLPELLREKKARAKSSKPLSSRQRNINSKLEADWRKTEIENWQKEIALESQNQDSTKRQSKRLKSRQSSSDGALILFGGFSILMSLLFLWTYWVLFERSGLPGWGILIPIYNLVLISKMAGKSGWWTLWMFIPFIGAIIWSASTSFLTAKRFDRSDTFAIATIFLPFICFPIIAFSER